MSTKKTNRKVETEDERMKIITAFLHDAQKDKQGIENFDATRIVKVEIYRSWHVYLVDLNTSTNNKPINITHYRIVLYKDKQAMFIQQANVYSFPKVTKSFVTISGNNLLNAAMYYYMSITDIHSSILTSLRNDNIPFTVKKSTKDKSYTSSFKPEYYKGYSLIHYTLTNLWAIQSGSFSHIDTQVFSNMTDLKAAINEDIKLSCKDAIHKYDDAAQYTLAKIEHLILKSTKYGKKKGYAVNYYDANPSVIITKRSTKNEIVLRIEFSLHRSYTKEDISRYQLMKFHSATIRDKRYINSDIVTNLIDTFENKRFVKDESSYKSTI